MKKKMCILVLLMVVSFVSGIGVNELKDNDTKLDTSHIMKVESNLKTSTVFVSLGE